MRVPLTILLQRPEWSGRPIGITGLVADATRIQERELRTLTFQSLRETQRIATWACANRDRTGVGAEYVSQAHQLLVENRHRRNKRWSAIIPHGPPIIAARELLSSKSPDCSGCISKDQVVSSLGIYDSLGSLDEDEKKITKMLSTIVSAGISWEISMMYLAGRRWVTCVRYTPACLIIYAIRNLFLKAWLCYTRRLCHRPILWWSDWWSCNMIGFAIHILREVYEE